jgi:predicted nucleic acid-binding protein
LITAIDSNVLFDHFLADSSRRDDAANLLGEAGESGPLVICDVVYSEIAGSFSEQAHLDEYLRDLGIAPRPSTERALYVAGAIWREYTRRRPYGLQCSRCGSVSRVTCESCGEVLTSRQHVVADFLIGAHALEHADRLLTRDRGFYGAYFPELVLA